MLLCLPCSVLLIDVFFQSPFCWLLLVVSLLGPLFKDPPPLAYPHLVILNMILHCCPLNLDLHCLHPVMSPSCLEPVLLSLYSLFPICVDLSLLTPLHCPLLVSFSSMTRPPPCPLFPFLLLTCHMWSLSRRLHHVVSSYSCISRRGESSLIGGVSADRLTNSLFINGLSVPGSQRSQRTIQFSSIDFMSPCRAIFITGIKTLIKDKKRHHSLINSACTTELHLRVVYLPAPRLVCSYY